MINTIRNFLCFIALLISITSEGQGKIKGSVKVYDSTLETEGINVILVSPFLRKEVIGTVVNSTGEFEIKNIPSGKIDLQFSFIGCYYTIVKDIEINNDTIEIWNVPIFESNEIIAWDGYCEKKYLWGLIKIKKECGGNEYINNSKFPADNKIFIKCDSNENDSLLYELNPSTKRIEIDYKKLKTCGNRLLLSLGLMMQMQNFYYL